MDPFRGRVAVITGGAGGIGLALARAFAARGASLVLADLDAAALERARADLAASGAPLLTVPTDVTRLDSVNALAAAARERFGAVHIVCNNAGVALYGEIAAATHRDWQYVLNVDLWGVIHGVETFVPLLLGQNERGHIVNTASMAGLVGMQWLGIYSAAKFAVVGLSEALQRELRPHGIGVSVLCPMIVATAIDANSARMRPAALRNPGEPRIPENDGEAGAHGGGPGTEPAASAGDAHRSDGEAGAHGGGPGTEPAASAGDAHRSDGEAGAHGGGPGTEPAAPAGDAHRSDGEAGAHGGGPQMVGGTITAEEVARRVVRGIERGDMYILTHPEQRDILRRRAAKLDRMFEEDMW